jgi:hypothetical protein
MFKLKMLAAIAGVAGLCGAASAQYPVYPGPVYPVYPQPISPVYPQPVSPVYPGSVYPQPAVPVIVTPNAPIGVNPFTGGLDTTNTQVDSSFFDPGRDAARFNGTTRPVDRPIFDPYGNLIGRQSGTEWYNPQTGRWHGDVTNLTPNGSGGQHIQGHVYSGNPGAGRPPAQPGRPTPTVRPGGLMPQPVRPNRPMPYRPR